MALLKSAAYAALALPNRVFRAALNWQERPVFYDIDEVCPELRELERNHVSVRSELDALLLQKNGHIPAYQEVDRTQKRIATASGDGRQWRVFFLTAFGRSVEQNRALCPDTTALLNRVPGVFQAWFSILEAGKSVPAHYSPYGGYLRYHLGLVIPAEEAPTLKIAGCAYMWREEEGVLFDDTWPHEVENRSQSDRVVLVVDILRPMPKAASLVNWTTIQLLRFTYAFAVVRKAQRTSNFLRSDRGGRDA